MTVTTETRTTLTVSGQPMSAPLQNVRSVARQMVGHFVENVAPCGTLPGDAIHGDITAITRVCLELVVSTLDGQNIGEKTRWLESAAAGWAAEGVPIDTIQHAIHEGFKLGFDLVVSKATVTDYADLVDGAKLVIELLDRMTSAISKAYIREFRTIVTEHHTAVHTLTSALLGGHSTSTMARECGIDIAAGYFVLAIALPPHPHEADRALDGKVVARRKLRRVQTALARQGDNQALSLLSVEGGTILLPDTAFSDRQLDELISQLTHAAGVPIIAAVIPAPPATIPAAANQAHELLDIVQRLRCTSGVYRFHDLALEYQLTRPGPGREHLGALLNPLDSHPELLTTLSTHISNNLNRQRTARMLHIHTNTVDYRLKRVAQLTGSDPTSPSGLWHLRSALVARTYL